MGFVTALLDTLHVDAAARPRLLELLRDKNAHELHAAALQSGLDEAAANALKKLGGQYEETRAFTLPDGSARGLVFCKKISQTPTVYPRNGGKIAKKPL